MKRNYSGPSDLFDSLQLGLVSTLGVGRGAGRFQPGGRREEQMIARTASGPDESAQNEKKGKTGKEGSGGEKPFNASEEEKAFLLQINPSKSEQKNLLTEPELDTSI